jgi:hypothetical protein
MMGETSQRETSSDCHITLGVFENTEGREGGVGEERSLLWGRGR